MATYVENTCAWFRRNGFGPKFDHGGVYCIKVDGKIVYIGKGVNMLVRIAQHHVEIQKQKEKKQRILAEAKRKGKRISYDVLYDARGTSAASIKKEIGEKEGELIRKYRPMLNAQIPKEDDWHKYSREPVNAAEILKTIL